MLTRYTGASSPAEIHYYPSGLEEALAGAPNLCFLDVNSDRDRALRLITELLDADPSLNIVAMLGSDEPDFILRCLRQGAADFLLQPFHADQLETALSKLARLLQADDSNRREPAKVYCVMPAKGACGATTIACNMAFHWKRLGAKRILLADLDPLTGTISFLLKVKGAYSFMDVLLRSFELDGDLWRAMVTHTQGVDVLLAPEMMVEGINELRDAGPIVEFARQNYDVVILDTNGVYGEWALSQARIANELILVTTNELPALQAAQRALSYLDSNRIGRWKIRLVVNRYHKDVGLNREVIGTALHTDVFHIIPSDYEAVQRSLMEGKPIPANSAFGKSVISLVDRLGGRQETSKKSSALGGLLSLFSRTSS